MLMGGGFDGGRLVGPGKANVLAETASIGLRVLLVLVLISFKSLLKVWYDFST